MANHRLAERIIEYHRREAKDAYYWNVRTDFYDKITWDNIEPFLPGKGWILDAGGGVGMWSRKMVETTKCKVELLDITKESLKMAKKRIIKDGLEQRIEVLHGDIRSVPHPDESFDFVLSEGDPISICGNSEKAVSELSRVLKPNCHFVAGVDSTFSYARKMLSQGRPLDKILDFLRTGISPAVEDADFDSKSFTPLELMSILQRNNLKTLRIVGKPIGVGINMTDMFIEAIPIERRKQIFENKKETEKLSKIVTRIFSDPYIAGIGSHLQIVATKETSI